MNVVLFVFVFLILSNLTPIVSEIHQNITAEILYSLKKYFLTPWVCLLYSNKTEADDRDLFDIHKTLTKKHPILIASMPFRYYLNTITRPSFVDSSPLHAITKADNLTKIALPELINNPSMYKALWILFASNDFNYDTYFENINIPINTLFLVAEIYNVTTKTIPLVEVYRVAPHLSLNKTSFGNWSQGNEILGPKKQLPRRRRNLSGVTINATFLEEDIYARRNRKSDSNTKGIFGKIWNLLEETLHFKTDYIAAEANKHGNGGSNGMIQDLQTGRADAALGIIAMTPEREKVVDFAIPLLSTKYILYMRNQESVTSPTSFTKTFDIYIWFALIIHLFLFIFGGILCYWFAPFEKPEELYSCTFFVYASICQQGSRDPIRPWALRILVFFSYLGAMVLNTAYCSSLISSLTVAENQLFRNFDEFLNAGGYHVSCVRNSAEETIFYKNNTQVPFYDQLKNMMTPLEDNPTTIKEALFRICSSTKFALFATQVQVESYLNDVPCSIFPLDTFVRVEITFAFKKGFPYLNIINKEIKDKLESGLINHFLKELIEPENPKVLTVDAIDVNDIIPFVIILLSGVIVSMALFLGEYMFQLKNINNIDHIAVSQTESNENLRSLPYIQ